MPFPPWSVRPSLRQGRHCVNVLPATRRRAQPQVPSRGSFLMAAEALICPRGRRGGREAPRPGFGPVGGGQSPAGQGPPLPPRPWHQPPQVHSSSNQASPGLWALPLTTPCRTGFLGHPGFQARRSLSKEEAQRAAHGTRGERQVREGPALAQAPADRPPPPWLLGCIEQVDEQGKPGPLCCS